jgi:ABC-2 type transport system ATP-binding protein
MAIPSQQRLMQPLISLRSLVKNYQDHRALDGVDLDVMPGITGLLGPNGAGKSSLIKAILGLVSITSGSGSVLGHRLAVDGKKIRNDIGYMPEDDCYIPGMTGVEVVHFAASLSGLPKVEGMRRSHEILDFCDMKQERYRAIETYSTGMRQKVKFAAAIVHDPKFLILDEPTSGLDPEEREALLQRISVLCVDAGKSVLLSTHILPDVQSVCDQVVILSKGRVRLNHSLAELNRIQVPTVEISVDRASDDFVRRLKDRSLEVSMMDNGNIEVTGESLETLTSQLWQVADESSTMILGLKPAMNSLESIFMKTVAEANTSSQEIADAR